MTPPPRITRIGAELPDGFDALRAEALGQGYGTLDHLLDEWASGTNRFAREGEALLAARVGDMLAGIGGITHDPAKADALRMRRFYTAAAFRRLGIARRIAEALLLLPRGHRTLVTVNAGTRDAPAFWESLGFIRLPGDGYTHVVGSDERQSLWES